ncbi:MAG: DMT family transporter [Rickettsiaceae bacterium]|nr:DMT family transporter [Rickettsiaceae bacterium]
MKATYYVLFAFALDGIKTAIVKSLNTNTPLSLVIFMQFFICAIYFCPRILKSRGQILIPNNLNVLIFRSLVGTAYWYFMFLAVSYLPLFNVSVLVNLSPIWVLIITSLFIDKSYAHGLFGITIIGFIGTLLILKPSMEIINIGIIFGLISGISMAITIILLKSSLKTENSDRILIYYFWISSIALLPLVVNSDIMHISIYDWMLIFINAILMLFHQISLNKGLELGLPTEMSILAYSSVLFSFILGVVFWHEIPDILSCIGGLIIMTTGIYIIKRQN